MVFNLDSTALEEGSLLAAAKLDAEKFKIIFRGKQGIQNKKGAKEFYWGLNEYSQEYIKETKEYSWMLQCCGFQVFREI